MGEVIKEALIIESNGLRTSCFIVENLPWELVYHKAQKLMPMDEYSERMVPAFTLDEQGKRHPTGELIDELHSGIEIDGAGSGAFVFPMSTDDSVQALKRVDKHIEDTIKDPALRPARIPYAQQPMSPSSGPRPYHAIIRVKLPEPVSPPVVPTTEQVRSALPVKVRKPMTEEQKAAARERMAKARLARKTSPQA